MSKEFSEVLRSLEVRLITRQERALWDALMRRYHYLGLHSLVGESLRYIALYQGDWLALIGWSAASLKCRVRDQWIGWPAVLQWRRLPLVANNTRFLILPQHSIPNLASRILALNLKRLSSDWEAIYGHHIWLVETFVDPRYFQGTCYRAQGWTFLGYTRGFAKSSHHYTQHAHPKMVFVRPLEPRERLSAPSLELPLQREVKSMRLSEKLAFDLRQRLLRIPEPRQARGIRHGKISLLVLSLCAIICNARSFSAISEWAKGCSQNMLKRLGCRFNEKTQRYEPPSEPTIRRFLQKVDAEEVDKALCDWLRTLAGKEAAVAVDGKTLKGARQANGRQVHLLSAFLHQKGMVLAQQQVESKTNEIPNLKPLLEPLALEGCVVTLDALHTQKETALYLVEEKGADYLMTVKDNQANLKKDIEDLQLVAFPPSAQNHR